MTVEQTAAPARTDVRATTLTTTPARPFTRHGLVLTAGALAWAGAQVTIGIDPVGHAGEIAFALSSGLFQVGLLCLVRVLFVTGALGTGRLARGALRFETVLIALAMCSTASDGLGITDFDNPLFVVLDICWPLSMAGMFFIGIRIAIAGRWSGASRFWPMVAESWGFVVIPTMIIAGEAAASVVSPLHLTLGYGVLGLVVARKVA